MVQLDEICRYCWRSLLEVQHKTPFALCQPSRSKRVTAARHWGLGNFPYLYLGRIYKTAQELSAKCKAYSFGLHFLKMSQIGKRGITLCCPGEGPSTYNAKLCSLFGGQLSGYGASRHCRPSPTHSWRPGFASYIQVLYPGNLAFGHRGLNGRLGILMFPDFAWKSVRQCIGGVW